MERFGRILVCIKHPDQAGWLLAAAEAVSRAARSQEVHLLHIRSAPPAGGGPEFEKTGPEKLTSDGLRAIANEHLKGHGRSQVFCSVVVGSEMVEILRYAMDQEVDLIILGRRAGKLPNEATLARRVTMKSTCSVLVVPAGTGVSGRRVLVPVRNSECSARAAETACAIAAANLGRVRCMNVFPVRGDYLEADLTLEEHTALMRQWADRENQQILQSVNNHGLELATVSVPDIHGRPAGIILEAVESESPDLVVIGARGRTGAAGVLLGAVTEQLICQSPVPVLAVKRKGECIGLLRALLTLAG
ncbi:MAG TPA: universal stress protein [Phycisphaerae bacterium]|nr:universal stress protein [Phycisphaerae bacterium]